MAYPWLRWPTNCAQLIPPTNPAALKTQQIPVKGISQPNTPTEKIQKHEATNASLKNAPDCKIQQGEAMDSALVAIKNLETRRAQRLRRNKRRREAKREKKQMEIQNQIREMFSNAGDNNKQELDDAKKRRLQKLAKKQLRKQKISKRRAAKQLQRQQMEVESKINEKVSETRADMQKLVEAEKQKVERFFSLARKYYGMWKTLNDQLKSASKSGKEEPTSHVRIFFLFVSLRLLRGE